MGSKTSIELFLYLLFYFTITLTKSQGIFGVPSSILNDASKVVPSMPKETTTEKAASQVYPTIKFGNNNVSILQSNEIIHENGTSTLKLSLSNGIQIIVNSVPKEENGMKFYTSSGTFEFRTPDSFSYITEFEAEPTNFTVLTFERRNKFLQRANPKLLAALAGR